MKRQARQRRSTQLLHVTIVRHARAGSKRAWTGRDEERPLDDVGAAQAVALADSLAVHRFARLVASPTLRCVQTLQPLATATGLPIERWAGLGPHAGAGPVRAALRDPAFDGAVLCTHGEVLRPLLRTLRRRNPGLTAVHGNGRRLLVKGSAWVMTLGPDGRLTSFVHLPPVT